MKISSSGIIEFLEIENDFIQSSLELGVRSLKLNNTYTWKFSIAQPFNDYLLLKPELLDERVKINRNGFNSNANAVSTLHIWDSYTYCIGNSPSKVKHFLFFMIQNHIVIVDNRKEYKYANI